MELYESVSEWVITYLLPRLPLDIADDLLPTSNNLIHHLLRLGPRLLDLGRLGDAAARRALGRTRLGRVGLGRDGVLNGLDDARLGVACAGAGCCWHLEWLVRVYEEMRLGGGGGMSR